MSWTFFRGVELLARVEMGCDSGTEESSQAIKGQSLQEVPHDEGTLSESIEVIDDPTDKTRKLVTAGGGPGTGFIRVPYAFKWHENRANFQKGRKSKYVYDPLFQVGPKALMKSLLSNLRRVL
jgi:hypothetical protein